MKELISLICFLSLFLFSSCKECKNEPKVKEEPTLEEIHALGLRTLNEILLEYEVGIQGKEFWLKDPYSKNDLRGYGPVQRETYYGFTKDVYLAGKPQLCYLNINSYQGYYLVDIHSVVLSVKVEPFTEYEQVDSPKCGYIPSTYTDPSQTMPNGFNKPIRGFYNDGYQPGGFQYFRTYYIKIVSSIDGMQINHTLPDRPENFEWNVAYREAE